MRPLYRSFKETRSSSNLVETGCGPSPWQPPEDMVSMDTLTPGHDRINHD